MVASIMSKKFAAGSTHLVIDFPVGPAAKVTSAMEAMRLRKLFEFVGDHFGIAVEVVTTDGRQPIGNGIGPVLEAQDVMAVLANEPAAPPICARSRCGSPRIYWNTIRSCAAAPGYARARELLDSGAALKQMHKIIEAQGPSACKTDIGTLTADILRRDDGVIAEIDCLRLNRLARTAGAPIDKGAGIKLFKKIGDRVEQGEPLYRIYAFDPSEFDLARRPPRPSTGYIMVAPHPRPARRRRERGRHSMPAVFVRDDAARLASRLGVPLHEIDVHRISRWGSCA